MHVVLNTAGHVLLSRITCMLAQQLFWQTNFHFLWLLINKNQESHTTLYT